MLFGFLLCLWGGIDSRGSDPNIEVTVKNIDFKKLIIPVTVRVLGPGKTTQELKERSEGLNKIVESMQNFPLKEPKPVSWIESLVVFLNNRLIRKFLFESLYETYDYVLTDPELKKLNEECEELRTIRKKLQKYLLGQENMLQESPQFFEEISKLQLHLEE